MAVFEALLIALLTFTCVHILIFYYQSLTQSIQETTSVRYALYIAIGCFFCLFVHNKEIYRRFGARDVEQAESDKN